MGKCYNLTFDSTDFYGGANNNKRTYFVNWSFLPNDKSYKVTFSYMSVASTNVDGLTAVMSLLLNLGATDSFFADNTGINSTQFMGNLKVASVGTNNYFFADKTTNQEIYLNSRPTQNVLEVQLHQGLSGTNFANPVPTNYVLTLCFEECE